MNLRDCVLRGVVLLQTGALKELLDLFDLHPGYHLMVSFDAIEGVAIKTIV